MRGHVPDRRFQALKWPLVWSACLVYAALWGTFASVLFWDEVYSRIFPGWSRWLLPVVYGALFGGVALAFWTLSGRLPRRQAVAFCVLGGLVSVPGHLVGIARGLLRVPLLAEVSVASALVFGIFEFIVYWCGIVALACVFSRVGAGRRGAA